MEKVMMNHAETRAYLEDVRAQRDYLLNAVARIEQQLAYGQLQAAADIADEVFTQFVKPQ